MIANKKWRTFCKKSKENHEKEKVKKESWKWKTIKNDEYLVK